MVLKRSKRQEKADKDGILTNCSISIESIDGLGFNLLVHMKLVNTENLA